MTPDRCCFLYLVDGMQLRNVRLQKRIDERFHQRGQKFTHILRPSLSLSGLEKVKKCGVEVRTSPREDEDHAFCSFFSNVEKWIKWRNSSKQTEGRTHAHTRLKRERERQRERCCYRRVILTTTARERILLVLVLTKSRKVRLLKVKMHSIEGGGLP